jgi:alkylated DNA repair dioxygenase AlkB
MTCKRCDLVAAPALYGVHRLGMDTQRYEEPIGGHRPHERSLVQSRLGMRTTTGATVDLFERADQSALPQGFRYLSPVLSTSEEAGLVKRFQQLPLQPFEFQGFLANRRIFTFGHKYAFAGQKPRADARIPDYLRPLIELAAQISEASAEAFEQVMVTEYAPGAGIGWHRDRPLYEDIVAVSFFAPCTLRLRRKKGDSWERRSAYIEPRSSYLLHGPVRDEWQHSIAPMDSLRYSVPLRTFRPGKAARGREVLPG